MTLDTTLALALFALLMTGTPGPANILAMAAGASWGVRSCLPFLIGLLCGKLLLNLLMGVGLLTLLAAHPLLAQTLRIVSALYLLWLAWRIVGLRLRQPENAATTRPGFFAGLVVHPLNPKAWAMSSSAYAQFADPQGSWLGQSAVIVLTFFLAQTLAHSTWCFGGARLAALIGGTAAERWLMWGLAASLVLLVLWTMWRQA